MATTAVIDDISGGDVVYDLTSSVVHTTVRTEFVRMSDGTSLLIDSQATAASITVTFTATVNVAMIVSVVNLGVVVETAPPVFLTAADFGTPLTYITFAQDEEATQYNVYITKTSDPLFPSTLVGSTVIPQFRDPSVYVTLEDAADIIYEVNPVIDGVETTNTQSILYRTRHARPTCELIGDIANINGFSHYQVIQFSPMRQLRGQHQGHRRQIIGGTWINFQSIEMVPHKTGKFGAYVLQDAKVSMEQLNGPAITDFIVPKTATANLEDLVLVPRIQTDTSV